MDRKQFEAKIIAKAWKDEKFRAALKADPKGTLSAELEALHSGAKLPENLQVTVVEESSDHICLVIPNAPVGVSGALSEAQLEAVAGGATFQGAMGTGDPTMAEVVTMSGTLDVVAQVAQVVVVVASAP